MCDDQYDRHIGRLFFPFLLSDPAYHRSLNYITSLPPSLQSTHGGNSPAMLGGGSSSSPLASKNLLTSPFSSDRLMIVRAPRRSANEEMTRREQEQKDAQADYDAGGLRPRAIKSVAALLSAGVAAAGKKPTHLRIGGLMAASSPQADDDLVVATRPTLPVASSTLARFTRGLKLPSRSDATSASRAPPMIELGDDVLLESPVPVMLPTTHYLGSGGEAPEEKEETSPRDIATPPPKEAVLIAAEQGATCCICTTSDFVEPWISHCKHICCSECWITWLNENPDKQVRNHTQGGKDQCHTHTLCSPSHLSSFVPFFVSSVSRVRVSHQSGAASADRAVSHLYCDSDGAMDGAVSSHLLHRLLEGLAHRTSRLRRVPGTRRPRTTAADIRRRTTATLRRPATHSAIAIRHPSALPQHPYRILLQHIFGICTWLCVHVSSTRQLRIPVCRDRLASFILLPRAIAAGAGHHADGWAWTQR